MNYFNDITRLKCHNSFINATQYVMLNRGLCYENFNEQSFDNFDKNKILTDPSISVPTYHLTSTVANSVHHRGAPKYRTPICYIPHVPVAPCQQRRVDFHGAVCCVFAFLK